MSDYFTAADFLTAFRTRYACCRALLELSAEQAALIAADEYSELIPLLQHKQQVLDVLLDTGREKEVWQAWKSERDRLPADQRAECERTLAETETLLKQLVDAEQASTEQLTARRNATEQALCAANQGGMALTAYGALEHHRPYLRLDVDS